MESAGNEDQLHCRNGQRTASCVLHCVDTESLDGKETNNLPMEYFFRLFYGIENKKWARFVAEGSSQNGLKQVEYILPWFPHCVYTKLDVALIPEPSLNHRLDSPWNRLNNS